MDSETHNNFSSLGPVRGLSRWEQVRANARCRSHEEEVQYRSLQSYEFQNELPALNINCDPAALPQLLLKEQKARKVRFA